MDWSKPKYAESPFETIRRLLMEALRVEFESEDIYIHYGKVPSGMLVDPIPIDKYIDICIDSNDIQPDSIAAIYEECRKSLQEFEWGEKCEHN
tara:strand:+ start:734 stop:1012 length:279 start_codon:yes stop_codon:yes gene_type:complete